MTKLALALLLAIAFAVALRGPGTTRRELRELGDVSVPKRLEPYAPQERDGYALFAFDHTHPTLMGSSRPITARLTIAVWTAESRRAAHDAALVDAADRTRDIRWSTDGDVRIGEGTHEVNASTHPAWIVARDVDGSGLTIAYMSWQQDASLDLMRRTVSEVVASFRPKMTAAQYLAIARDRPGMLRSARRRRLDSAMAKRGGVRDGAIYHTYDDAQWGARLIVLHPLGTLPAGPRYRALNPPLPRDVGHWPEVLYFTRDGDRWAAHPTQDSFILPASLVATIGARLGDDATRAHFFAAEGYLLDDPDMPEPDLDWLAGVAARMVPLLRDGKLVR